MIDKYTKELERALDPRRWNQELNDAWHKNIPDLQKAFDAIKDIAIKRAKNKNETAKKISLVTTTNHHYWII